jgi:hypothetical protein
VVLESWLVAREPWLVMHDREPDPLLDPFTLQQDESGERAETRSPPLLLNARG